MQLIVCPGCGESLSAARVEEEGGYARCPDCSTVFHMVRAAVLVDRDPTFRSIRIEAPLACTTELRDKPRAKRLPSSGYRSPGDRDGETHEVALSWRYPHQSPGLALFIGVITTLLTLLWVGVASEKELPLYLVVAFMAPFAMLSLGFFYSFAVASLDRMFLSLRGEILSISTAPLPVPKVNFRMEARQVEDVYVRKTVVASSTPSSDRTADATYFEVRVFLASGEGQRLTQFRDVEMALYVAQCLSESLGLPPGPSDKLHQKMQSLRSFHEERRKLYSPKNKS
jgi:hypothetical protein